jgi:hypothetical protein
MHIIRFGASCRVTARSIPAVLGEGTTSEDVKGHEPSGPGRSQASGEATDITIFEPPSHGASGGKP